MTLKFCLKNANSYIMQIVVSKERWRIWINSGEYSPNLFFDCKNQNGWKFILEHWFRLNALQIT